MAGSNLDIFVPEVWSPKVNRWFKKKLTGANFFTDYSSDIAGGGDKVHIPDISGGSFTATSITATTGSISAEAFTESTTALDINNWWGAAMQITDYQATQAARSYNMRKEYMQALGYNLAEKLDTVVLDIGASVTASVGDSGTDITTTAIESAIAVTESNSVPLEDCAFFLHPKSYWKEIMQNSKLVEASKYGKAILPNAPHNELYGIPVYISANVPAGTAGSEGGHRNLLANKKTIVWGTGNLPGSGEAGVRLQTLKGSEPRVKLVADLIYGAKILNANAGSRIISKN